MHRALEARQNNKIISRLSRSLCVLSSVSEEFSLSRIPGARYGKIVRDTFLIAIVSFVPQLHGRPFHRMAIGINNISGLRYAGRANWCQRELESARGGEAVRR